MFVALGKKTVATAGTPVQVVLVTTNCNAVYFQALSTNTGKVYVGLSGLVKATLVNVLRVLVNPPATPLFLDSWSPQGITIGPIDLVNVFLDVDTNGEGALISYLAC